MYQLSKFEIDFWLNDEKYPLTIVADRYGGCYSGAKYLAFPYNFHQLDEDIDGDDVGCMLFWKSFDGIVGKGATIDDALDNLELKMRQALDA